MAIIDRVQKDMRRVADKADRSEVDLSVAVIRTGLLELDNLLEDLTNLAPGSAEKRCCSDRYAFFAEEGLIPLRLQELKVIERVKRLLEQNGEVANRLQSAVNRLVELSKANIREASRDAIGVQRVSSWIMIAVVLASVLSATLITWLYVQRNLIARLTRLSGSMMAIAEGELRTEIPKSRGADEIDVMAQALVTFRDTAVEIEEKNLREVATARQRLIDALESSSEGFAFYDSDDRLVLSNSRYRELLYGDADVDLNPGTKFESILRNAIDQGLIEDAVDDPEAWIAQRLEQRRDPGPPQLQRRSGDQWVLSERAEGYGRGIGRSYLRI